MSDPLVERGVTRKEAEVLTALSEHLSNAEIASRLYISERTVESHVSSLLRKLQVSNRRELARAARTTDIVAGRERPVMPPMLELAAESVMSGRRAEVDRLLELWERAKAGRLLVAVVAGEAGIGKSRLVAELAVNVHRGGGSVVLGSCFEDDETPYLPFLQIMEAALAGGEDSDLRRGVETDVQILGTLLLTRSPRGDVTETIEASVERAGLLAAIHREIVGLAEANPVLLILEDLHWATATTRDVVRHLARAVRPVPLMVVVTCRDTPPDVSDDVAGFLGELARQPNCYRIDLHGLDARGVEDLAAQLNEHLNAIDVPAIWALTGGNPLFVLETLAFGVSSTSAGTSVSRLLSGRTQRLSRGDNVVLDLAAVLGAEFNADVLAAATDMPLLDVLEVLERAEAAGLITALSRPGRFAFVHALFRSIRYQALPSSRRMRLHHQVAEVLAPRSGDDRIVGELARHAYAAAPLGDIETAIAHCSRAGELAMRALAFAEASAHFRRALDLVETVRPAGPDEARCETTIRLGEALAFDADPDALAVLEQGARLARHVGNPRLLAKVAWALCPFGLSVGRYNPLTVSLTEEALQLPSEHAIRARLLTVLAAHTQGREQPERRHRLIGEAIAAARQANDPVELGHVLRWYQWSAWSPDNLEARVAAADELAALGERLDQPIFLLNAQQARHENLLEAGEVADANHESIAIERSIGDRQDIFGQLRMATRRTNQLILAGELAAAEQTAETILGFVEHVEAFFDPTFNYGNYLMLIRFHQGRIAELLQFIESAHDTNPEVVAYRAVLAMARARAGEQDAARRLLRDVVERHSVVVPRHVQWYPAMMCLADTAEVVGATDAAATIADLLDPYTGRLAMHGEGVSLTVDIVLAQLALCRGQHERAALLAAREADASRRRNTPIFLARALVLHAAAQSRASGRRRQVRTLVEEALQIGRHTGAGIIEQEVARYQLR